MVLTFYPKRNMFGAASTSGQVMRNIALKMYSRGLLGETPDYAQGSTGTHRPMLYASNSDDRHAAVRKATGVASELHPAAPRKMPKGTVPSVAGLGLREAVVTLENAGFEVVFTGSGFVRGQTPAAGEPARKGTRVTLALGV